MPTITLFEASRASDRLATAITEIALSPNTQISLFSERAEREISKGVEALRHDILQLGKYCSLQTELRVSIISASLDAGLTALVLIKQKLQKKIERLKLLRDSSDEVLTPQEREIFMASARQKFEAGHSYSAEVVLSVTDLSFRASLRTLLKLLEHDLISVEREIDSVSASTEVDIDILPELRSLGFA